MNAVQFSNALGKVNDKYIILDFSQGSFHFPLHTTA